MEHVGRIAAAVRAREVSAVEVVSGALRRIERGDPALCAFAEVWDGDALGWAREVDARVAGGEALALAGVPIGVKGRYGLRAAEALVAAGCVPVGATAVPGSGTAWQTWGLGRHGRTVNPWRADRTPGGSSAGSAAAVAAGLVALATGSDGAGSVRIPAAWCGVVGLKATNGRLPSRGRTGLAAGGVLVRSAVDAGAYWRVVAGETAAEAPAGGLAAVWSPDLGFADVDAEPLALAYGAARRLVAACGARLLRPYPLRLEDPAPAWLALRAAKAAPAERAAADRVRQANDRRLDELFQRADLLLTPTTPGPPHGHAGRAVLDGLDVGVQPERAPRGQPPRRIRLRRLPVGPPGRRPARRGSAPAGRRPRFRVGRGVGGEAVRRPASGSGRR